MICTCGECLSCVRDKQEAYRIGFESGLRDLPAFIPTDLNGGYLELQYQVRSGWLAGEARRHRLEWFRSLETVHLCSTGLVLRTLRRSSTGLMVNTLK